MVHTHGVEGSTPPLATNLAEASDFSEAFFVVENFVEKGYDFILLCGKMIKNTAERPWKKRSRMKMTKKWEVTVNGINNVIEYKTGFGAKILVNGQAYKVKSQNWFVMMVDYPITINGTEIRVVAIGNKVDLAVNGVYQDSGEQYQPLRKTPTMCNVFLGISCIAGFLLCGWIGLLIGILFGTVYVKQGLADKTGNVVGAFIGCTVIQIIITVVVVFIQLG